MSKDDYLNKLNTIVEDKTKFKLVEKDNRKKLQTPPKKKNPTHKRNNKTKPQASYRQKDIQQSNYGW